MIDRAPWRIVSIVCGLVMMSGVLIDAWPLYQSVKQKQLEEAQLVNRLRDFQRMISLPEMNQHQVSASSGINLTLRVPLLTILSAIAHDSGARLISMYQAPANGKGVAGARAKYVLHGTYQALMQVIMRLQHVSKYLLIRDFTIKTTEQGGYILLIDVSILNMNEVLYMQGVILKKYVTSMRWGNPFCVDNRNQVKITTDDLTRLQMVSVNSLQLAGYFHWGNKVTAWLRLPEGDIAQTVRGDIIGHEQARVDVIAQDRVTLISSAGMRLFITPAGESHVQ